MIWFILLIETLLRLIVMTFLFDWMFLLFMGFVFVISSLVILYSGDYIQGVQLKSGPSTKP